MLTLVSRQRTQPRYSSPSQSLRISGQESLINNPYHLLIVQRPTTFDHTPQHTILIVTGMVARGAKLLTTPQKHTPSLMYVF